MGKPLDLGGLCGERGLMLAVLRQAVADLRGLVEDNGRIGHERIKRDDRPSLLEEVKDWFFTDDESPVSLTAVCDAIGLDPDTVREYVRVYLRAHAGEPRCIRSPRLRLARRDAENIRRELKRGAEPGARQSIRRRRFSYSEDPTRPAMEASPQGGRVTFYSDELTELRHGDCLDQTDGLASLADGSVDVFITDPPYSEHVHSKSRRGLTARDGELTKHYDLGFDSLTDDVRVAAAAEMARLARRWVLVFSDFESAYLWRHDLEGAGLEYVRTGIWHKGNATPQFTGDRPAVPGEAIVICHAIGTRKRWNGGGHQAWWPADLSPDELFIFDHNTAIDRRHSGEQRVHTTQKPLSLMRELVRLFSEPNELIVDPFAGFVTTLRAAKDLDRRSLGWELQEKYLEHSARRLGQSVLWRAPQQGTLA